MWCVLTQVTIPWEQYKRLSRDARSIPTFIMGKGAKQGAKNVDHIHSSQ